MTEQYIHVQNLYKIFGPKPDVILELVKEGQSKEAILNETGHSVALADIDLKIQKGEVFVIMGLSGSGKSTLIRHFNRLIDPTRGDINIFGTQIVNLSQNALETFRQSQISMVFQHFGLMPHKTVLENVAYGLKVRKVSQQEGKTSALEKINLVGLTGYEDYYPAQLSGGQKQRVGLARALCADTDIILMDEAFSALDPLIRAEMQDQLIELQEKFQKTIIFITHDLDEALRLGNRIAILKDGRISQVGNPKDILHNPADSYVEAFVESIRRKATYFNRLN